MKNKPLRRKVILIILDGLGISRDKVNNAVYLANTPRLDKFFSDYSHTLLEASGTAVGLPKNQIGNSEVGHITMGCGCIIHQDITRINKAIEDGSFFENPALLGAIKQAGLKQIPIHLLGLVSDGGVHSHILHLEALIGMCKQQQVVPLLHMITDGRDTPPMQALYFAERIEPQIKEAGGGIASVMGRYYAMDRDNRWDRTEKAWRAIALGEGKCYADVSEAIRTAHTDEVGDEFIEPAVLPPAVPLTADDSLILFNFRNDRPRQLIRPLILPDFSDFDRGQVPQIKVTTITEVTRDLPCVIAFAPTRPKVTVAKVISDAGLKQFHCAETEKYPHITFYFNGGVEGPLKGEERKLIPSPKVATYDLQPEMSAAEVADAVIDALDNPEYSFMVVNFANADMVGHTAVAAPILKAVETIDHQLGRIVDKSLAKGWAALVTADHGNCDEMLDSQTEQPNTRHTLNPVPCMIIDREKYQMAEKGNISCIAPTVLDLMGLEIPPEMEADSIISSS